MPIKLSEFIADKCKQLDEPPPKPQQEQQKKGKTVPLPKEAQELSTTSRVVPLTDKKKPKDQNT